MSTLDAAGTSRSTQRWRFGWAFAAIWLVYLSAPLRALLDHPSGWERDLGLVGLAGFVAAYLAAVAEGRRTWQTGEERSLASRWLQVGALVVLAGLMIPAAGQNALTASVYLVAAAMMNLPVRQGLATAAVLFVLAEALPRIVPGWQDGGYGLAVLLAAAAVWASGSLWSATGAWSRRRPSWAGWRWRTSGRGSRLTCTTFSGTRSR